MAKLTVRFSVLTGLLVVLLGLLTEQNALACKPCSECDDEYDSCITDCIQTNGDQSCYNACFSGQNRCYRFCCLT